MNILNRRADKPETEATVEDENLKLGSGSTRHKKLCIIEWRTADAVDRPIIAGYNQGRSDLPVFITNAWSRVPVDVAPLLVTGGAAELIRPEIQKDVAQAAEMGLFPIRVAEAIIACIKTRQLPFEIVLDFIEFRTRPAQFETTWKARLLPEENPSDQDAASHQ